MFDTDPSETLTNAVYTWKSYQQPIVAQAREVLRNNNTPEGVINMWLSKADVAMRSLRSKLNANAFADGTGNGGKNILGLAILVDSTGTVGGLNRSTAAYWAANETADTVLDLVAMTTMYNDCMTGSADQGNRSVDGIFTTQAVAQFYEALLTATVRYIPTQTGSGALDSNATSLGFKGAPMFWDADCTSGITYFLNSSALEAWVHPDRDFTTTEIAKADNGTLQQDAWIANILVWLELAIAEPRRTGKLTGTTS